MNTVLQNISIELPTADIRLLKELVQRMGWSLTYPQDVTKKKKADISQSLEHLKGCLSLPNDFDYKKELGEFMISKYETL